MDKSTKPKRKQLGIELLEEDANALYRLAGEYGYYYKCKPGRPSLTQLLEAIARGRITLSR